MIEKRSQKVTLSVQELNVFLYVTMWIKQPLRSKYTMKNQSISLWARLRKNWTTHFAPHNKIVLWDKLFFRLFYADFDIFLSTWNLMDSFATWNRKWNISENRWANWNFQQRLRFIFDEYFICFNLKNYLENNYSNNTADNAVAVLIIIF